MLFYAMPPEEFSYNENLGVFPEGDHLMNFNDFLNGNLQMENEFNQNMAAQFLNNPDLVNNIENNILQANVNDLLINQRIEPVADLPNELRNIPVLVMDHFLEDGRLSEEADEFFTKMHEINDRLTTNLIGCDAIWTFFIVAANSPRYNNVLTILPEWVIKNNEVDIAFLTRVLNSTPPLLTYFERLGRDDSFDADNSIMDLLHWLFCLQTTYLKRLVVSEKAELLRSLDYPDKLPHPDHIFEIKSTIKPTPKDELFNYQTACFPIYWTYHGEQLDRFFGLVQSGFEAFYYGQDKPLTLHLNIKNALRESPRSPAWPGSMLNASFSCIAVAECIDKPSALQYLEAENAIEVQDPSATRIRYIFMYNKPLNLDEPAGKLISICGFIKNQQPYKLFGGCVILFGSLYLVRNQVKLGWLSKLQSPFKYFCSSLFN